MTPVRGKLLLPNKIQKRTSMPISKKSILSEFLHEKNGKLIIRVIDTGIGIKETD